MLQQKPWHLPTAEAKANFECCENSDDFIAVFSVVYSLPQKFIL